MKKLFVEYVDGGKVKITMKDWVDEIKYVQDYIKRSYVKSIVFQQYPKKDNEPIVYK